ncbi:hypothetical protein ACLM5J_08630 [Nocardioides sp. Bht2]|uniref:hypothetical protein n=1 Tax=Nocardioides sp. Bht2 TaxID=3392297 RepID=UPI0039B6974C
MRFPRRRVSFWRRLGRPVASDGAELARKGAVAGAALVAVAVGSAVAGAFRRREERQ